MSPIIDLPRLSVGNLFDLPARSFLSPTPSDTSSHSSLTSPLRKQRFDDRSQTKISIALKSHQINTSHHVKDSVDVHRHLKELDINEILKWSETSTITGIINSSDFIASHGSVNYTEPSSIYIALGTNKGRIVVFNYHQGVEFILGIDSGESQEQSDHHQQNSEISTIAFSSDSIFLAAGYTSGHIRLWDLSSKLSSAFPGTISPYFTINPITLQDRFTKNHLGHLRNTPINQISFIADLHIQLISVDISGLVFYHNGIKKFLQKYFISQKILGKNDANITDSKYFIYGCSLLPLGSSHQITDQLGVMAVITSNVLIIVSALSLNNSHTMHTVEHFKVGKSKQVMSSTQIMACLDWFPCMEVNNKTINAKLAYSWNNVLNILEVDNSSFPSNLLSVVSDLKDKDKGIPKLPIKKVSRWNTTNKHDSIVSVKWISSDILCVFIKEGSQPHGSLKVTALYLSNGILKRVGNDRILGLDIFTSSLHGTSSPRAVNTTEEAVLTSYENSIKVFKHRLLALTDSDNIRKLYIGRLLSWADVLLGLLSSGKYAEALSTANEFYNSANTGKLVLVGLPEDPSARFKLVRPYLIQIMKESVPHLFSYGYENLHYFLTTYFSIISNLTREDSKEDLLYLLEMIFEKLDEKSIFFDVLESYTLSGSISSLPPLILKQLVEHYVKTERGELLTEILCILDIKTLDIDLTIQLCNQYNLRDCLIYIWNYLLDDYETPLVDFIKDFRNPEFLLKEDYLRAYSYMSFVLTGRQYPTDRFIDGLKDIPIKESICNILFSSTTVTWPAHNGEELHADNEDTIFPYLFSFLKANSFEMLSTLNEFFEEPYLNDIETKKLNRQYITDALLDIFEANEHLFTDEDRCQLAIFIGRNYAKYSQFIRLSESVLGRIINDLCGNTNVAILSDCELALQSLLPYYEPENDDLLYEKLTAAKYYSVLINIYKSEGRYSKVLEMWLSKLMNDPSGEFQNESLSQVLENSFMLTKKPVDRLSLINVIIVNFERFTAIDLDNFLVLISRFSPQLHHEALNIKDNVLMFKYLDELFHQSKSLLSDDPHLPNLISKNIELHCIYDKTTIFKFVETWKEELVRDQDQFARTIQILKDNQQVDSVAELVVFQGHYYEALKYILTFINSISASLDDEGLKSTFTKLLHQSMKICELAETYEEYDGDLILNEKMWLDLIGNVVNMASIMQHNAEVHTFLNGCIHDCFRAISDAKLNTNVGDSEKKEQSFLTIFNKFLESSSDNSTLANVRGILQENFVSYSYESEMLRISLSMLNQGIYKELKQIKMDNLSGWAIQQKLCASCGKIMWGPDVSQDNYSAWEDRQSAALYIMGSSLGTKFDNDKYHHCQLIFFKCSHGFHSSCLESLGVSVGSCKDKRGQVACVICSS